jgi:hypothetical protein
VGSIPVGQSESFHVHSRPRAVTFVVVLLVLYLINMLPIKQRGKEVLRVVVIIIGVLSLLGVIMNF